MFDTVAVTLRLYVFIALTSPMLSTDTELHIFVTENSPPSILLTLIGETNKVQTLPITPMEQPIAIDFDRTSKVIYWSDGKLKEIRATALDMSFDKIVLTLEEDSIPDGLSIDVTRGLIFYTDSGKDLLGIVNIDGSNHRILIEETNSAPRAIVLHQEEQTVYWSQLGLNPTISQIKYDGSEREVLVTRGLIMPNGLALDKKEKKMFWCDGSLNTIEWIFLNGTGRHSFYKTTSAQYNGIFLHGGTLYVTDSNRKSIMAVNSSGGKIAYVSTKRYQRLTGIHVYSELDVEAIGCPPQTYGPDCKKCSFCKTDTVCEKVTGHCLGGCVLGYNGISIGKCDEECSLGTYGSCNTTCSSKCRSSVCHHVTGVCTYGCLPGYLGDICDKDTTTDPTTTDPTTTDPVFNYPWGLIIGLSVGGVVLCGVTAAAIAVALYKISKKKRCTTERQQQVNLNIVHHVNPAYNQTPMQYVDPAQINLNIMHQVNPTNNPTTLNHVDPAYPPAYSEHGDNNYYTSLKPQDHSDYDTCIPYPL